MLTTNTTLNCRGRIFDLSRPVVMGILNMTPDSFYDGGQYNTLDKALDRANQMWIDGAQIIDVGGLSTRPGSKEISEQEEIDRVCPIVEKIKLEFPEAIISIDTYKSKVLNAAYKAGADILNDISGGSFDNELWNNLSKLNIPYILMHIQNSPLDMQKAPIYKDILTELVDYFSLKVSQLNELGVYDIMIDPGFGFGKTMQHNYYLLKNLHVFKLLGLPLMIGISRKSMIYKFLNIKTEASLEATTAAHMYALNQGVKILRVHDVRPAAECVKLYNYINEVEC